MRSILFFIFLFLSTPSFAECEQHLPLGAPTINSERPITRLCRIGYALGFDDRYKVPAWVAYVLEPRETISCALRKNQFAADPDLPARLRATKSDYTKSGFDAGHMVPDADVRFDPEAVRESYYMSNMAPQTPALNRGAWAALEAEIRAWSYGRGASLVIIAGTIIPDDPMRIGANRVAVPGRFYKVVHDPALQETLAFLFENNVNRINFTDAITTVDEIERQAKIVLPIDHRTSRTTPWPSLSREMRKGRTEACK